MGIFAMNHFNNHIPSDPKSHRKNNKINNSKTIDSVPMRFLQKYIEKKN